MTRPQSVSVEAWDAAVAIASTDRVRLARLVNAGTVRRVRGERNAIVLPARPGVNLAVRPKRRKR